jgi:coenzyme F420-reducing hydrogenase alpha subunit
MVYGPAPEPLNTVAVPKFQLYVVPADSVPVKETFTVVPTQADEGRFIEIAGAAETVTEAVAGKDVHPLLVTVKLGVMVPAFE